MSFLQSVLHGLSQPNTRILRFLISGGTAAAVNFSVLYTLTEFFSVWYLFSSIGAVLCAILVNFTLQKFWAFREPELARIPTQLSMFVTVAFTNLVLNTIILYMLVEWFSVWYLFAQVIAAAVLGCVSYYLYKTHIFAQ